MLDATLESPIQSSSAWNVQTAKPKKGGKIKKKSRDVKSNEIGNKHLSSDKSFSTSETPSHTKTKTSLKNRTKPLEVSSKEVETKVEDDSKFPFANFTAELLTGEKEKTVKAPQKKEPAIEEDEPEIEDVILQKAGDGESSKPSELEEAFGELFKAMYFQNMVKNLTDPSKNTNIMQQGMNLYYLQSLQAGLFPEGKDKDAKHAPENKTSNQDLDQGVGTGQTSELKEKVSEQTNHETQASSVSEDDEPKDQSSVTGIRENLTTESQALVPEQTWGETALRVAACAGALLLLGYGIEKGVNFFY